MVGIVVESISIQNGRCYILHLDKADNRIIMLIPNKEFL